MLAQLAMAEKGRQLMEDKTITVVAGLGRCGSSMVMQMLVAGGMGATGAAGPPFWEDGRVTWLPSVSEWLRECEGKALKILGLNRMYPPDATNSFRWIWMDRERDEQVKSQHKLAEWMGRRRAPIDLGKARRESLAKIDELGGPLLRLQYEDIVHTDGTRSASMAMTTAVMLAQFCGLPSTSVDAMASVVRRRSSRCSREIEEERSGDQQSATAKPVIDIGRCTARDVSGTSPPCGLPRLHDGPHTWAAPPVEMFVQVAPVRVAQLTAECPACREQIVMLIQDRVAMHLANGHDLPGVCGKCGQKTMARMSGLVQGRPGIVVAKR